MFVSIILDHPQVGVLLSCKLNNSLLRTYQAYRYLWKYKCSKQCISGTNIWLGWPQEVLSQLIVTTAFSKVVASKVSQRDFRQVLLQFFTRKTYIINSLLFPCRLFFHRCIAHYTPYSEGRRDYWMKTSKPRGQRTMLLFLSSSSSVAWHSFSH